MDYVGFWHHDPQNSILGFEDHNEDSTTAFPKRANIIHDKVINIFWEQFNA